MIGPALPKHLQQDDDSDSEDDYGPSLPPDLARKPVAGPSFPTGPPPQDDESDDDVGPMPLPEGYRNDEEEDAVAEFMAKEERRKANLEESKKPKALQRDEWMLKPPEASDLLGSLDPTKLRPRQFSRNTEEKSKDQTLWTETPAERLKRLSDEVQGKRKRAEVAAGGNAAPDEVSPDAQRKRRRDDELQRAVQEHNKKIRPDSLLDIHSKTEAKKSKTEDDKAPPAIWDRDRDMGLGGRLMDEKTRSKIIQDARGLGDRFGHSKGGSYM